MALKVGKPDVKPDTPAHTPGVKQGKWQKPERRALQNLLGNAGR